MMASSEQEDDLADYVQGGNFLSFCATAKL
jgi:hypothetical protein